MVKDISVEVYPFELPLPKPVFGIFYFIDRICGTDIDPALNPPYRTKPPIRRCTSRLMGIIPSSSEAF